MHYKNKKKSPSGTGKNNKDVIKANIYGKHAVLEAWYNPQRHVKNLYITSACLKDLEHDLMIKSKSIKRPTPVIVDKEIIEKYLPKGAVHQGIALDCLALDEMDLDDLMRLPSDNKKNIILILDQVTDPHNIGAIIRSCAAFNAKGIILQRRYAPQLNGVLAKIACGGLEHVPIILETNLSRTIEALQKEHSYTVIGLDERGKFPLHKASLPDNIALVLGAEGVGIRRLVAEKCDYLVQLPTSPPIASLNVSNAAAVALYDLSLR